ncbi:alpha/beta hydrolase [Rhizobium sp. B230/85]|nr:MULTISPECIES: alpha/beta hydrolase [unclassified Rhizobium]MBO9131732.1 alpha/beta hydrolase [Rhizobium sp. B209b/85]QXZ82449.1 alpha/beta hydrolase [Rhizobium sp. K1/93]QXZ90039.1 alpha/beta hydrolase [Rhizobium sp. K15/93]QXZ95700.1 alpha/beta hydrolase [Rhizobium sp. B230/85]QYA02575.1 alpha/beta hydrolase [Rhizobium sp. B21/90]
MFGGLSEALSAVTESILFSTPDNPVPDNRTEGYFTTHDGHKLRYAIFRSSHAVAKGTVILLHGRNEFIEKYFETIRELTDRGLWVATFDLRGQGGSGRLIKHPSRGHVRRFSDYEHDLEDFMEHVVLPDTRLPFYLVAHSTGALIALSAAPRLTGRIERMVLSAPFVGLTGQSASPRVIRFMASAACAVGLGSIPLNRKSKERPFATNLLTSDEQRYDRNSAIAAARPDLVLGPPSARWLQQAFQTIDRVSQPEHLFSIAIPTLLLAPTRDGIIPYAEQERLSRSFRAAQLVPIAGARHEVFQEKDVYRAAAMAAIHAFIPGSDAEANTDPVGSGL